MVASSGKKRAAPSSTVGPAKKKPHTESSSSDPKQQKKRAKPIVQHESESEEDDDDEEGNDTSATDGDADFLGEATEEGMDIDERPAKDPNAARESHRAQRALLEQRRAAKPNASLLTDAKRTWALARQKNISQAEKKKHISALMDVIRGKVQDIVFKHDASRIVQTVVKRGDEKIRNEIASELKGRYCELAQNKYSKFLVTKIARLCPTYRTSIILEFKGRIHRLILHREASRVLADIYELYANAYERSLLVRDLYGRETALFSSRGASDGEAEKERARAGLKGVLEGLDIEQRRRILAAVKENLCNIFNNSDKGSVRHAIVHRVLWEYLSALNDFPDEAEREKLRREILESCQDLLAEMVHTKDGSRAVREFLAEGTAKDRKQILKVLKPYIETMAKDDEAQLVLFTTLDVTDDTKLLAKSLVGPIIESASNLKDSAAGRRALLYLLVPRASRHFTPALCATLAETDSSRDRTSKKDASTRAAEIRIAASEGLLSWVVREGATVSRDTAGSLLVLDVIFETDGDKTSAMEALLKPLLAPYPSQNASSPHPADLTHTAKMYKKLFQGGHFIHKTQSLELAERWSVNSFTQVFMRTVGREATVAMAAGNGAFIIAAFLEALKSSEASVREEVRSWFDGFKADTDNAGGRLLGQRLKELTT